MNFKLWEICQLIFTCTYNDWYNDLTNEGVKGQIDNRIVHIKKGYVGSNKNLGNALFELKWKSTLRLYVGRARHTVYLIFGGEKKETQQRDIDKARRYWNDYKIEKLQGRSS